MSDRIETLKTHLPCGGELWLTFVAQPTAVESDRVDVACFPKVFCSGAYADCKCCPWIERVRKFYARQEGLDEPLREGDVHAGVGKPHVEDGDGTVGEVCDCHDWLVVFNGDKVLYDGQLRAKKLDEAKDLFEKCQNVEVRHGRGIIAFIGRAFGRGRRTKEA